MMIEKALNELKGKVIDYDVIHNGTIFALVKSKAGNYSIRQCFRNGNGEYQGWMVAKLFRKADEQMTRWDFEEMVSIARRHA